MRDPDAAVAAISTTVAATSPRRMRCESRIANSHRAAIKARLISVANWLRWRSMPQARPGLGRRSREKGFGEVVVLEQAEESIDDARGEQAPGGRVRDGLLSDGSQSTRRRSARGGPCEEGSAQTGAE